MYPTYFRFLFFSMIVLVAVSPIVAQAGQEPDVFDSSVVAPSVLPAESTGAPSQSAHPQQPESPSTEFRATVQDFRKHKHPYVHCKLKTGKILTGQIKDAGYEAFTSKTDALGGLHYINADYTVLIGRYPVGEWVGLEVAQQIDEEGISMGSATLVDRTGPFATSGGVSLARPPMAIAPCIVGLTVALVTASPKTERDPSADGSSSSRIASFDY